MLHNILLVTGNFWPEFLNAMERAGLHTTPLTASKRPMEIHQRNKLPQLCMLAVSLLVLMYFLVRLSGYYHDDAYIVLRYVRNFIDGQGLAWNPGEYVEGYSTFTWVMLISLFGCFHVDLVLATKILGVIFAFATVVGFFYLPGRGKTSWGALLLATNSCFALWALGGLETILFGFLLFLACSMHMRLRQSKPGFLLNGLLFSLAAMTRPEGLLFFGITFSFVFFNGDVLRRHNFSRAASFVTGFLLLYVPYFIWRFWFYGYLFPCTYYVKGGTNFFKVLFGSRYVLHFLFGYGFPLLSAVLLNDKKRFVKNNFYLFSLLCIFSMYILCVGGDHMQGYRFFTPILPLFYLFIQNIFHEISLQKKWRIPGIIFTAIISINFIVSYNSIPRGPQQNQEALRHSYKYKNCFSIPDPAAYLGRHIGTYIKKHWPRNAVVALNTAGSIPYYCRLQCIDMLGLNDYTIARRDMPRKNDLGPTTLTEIFALLSSEKRAAFKQKVLNTYLPWELIPGHGKGDGAYVLSREPDYIILGSAQGSTQAWFPGDKELISSPDFARNYRLQQVTIPVTDAYASYFEATRTGELLFTYYKKTTQGN